MRALGAIVAALAALLALGCASAAHREFVEARTGYEQCVAVAGEAKCTAEREHLLAAERAYQEAARRGWACDPAQPDCPTQR